MIAGYFCEELAADEIAAEDEEEIDAGPAPVTKVFVQPGRVAEHAIVIYEYDHDGQGAKMVEPCEAGGFHHL